MREAIIERSTPDLEFVPAVAASVDGEAVRGPDEVRRFMADLGETWEAFNIEVDEFRGVGEQVVILGRVHATGRGSGVELDQPFAMACWFRDGKFARTQSFLDHDAAIEAASEGRDA